MGDPVKEPKKFNISHPDGLYDYLGKYSKDIHQGYCKRGEIPLGIDESEQKYLDLADKDNDEDDNG